MEQLKKKVIEELTGLIDYRTLDADQSHGFDQLTRLLEVILTEPEYSVKERWMEKNKVDAVQKKGK